MYVASQRVDYYLLKSRGYVERLNSRYIGSMEKDGPKIFLLIILSYDRACEFQSSLLWDKRSIATIENKCYLVRMMD